jgi:hypothetical protein
MGDGGALRLEIVLLGRAVPDNALKAKFSVRVGGKDYQANKYTDAAVEWMDYVRLTAQAAVLGLPPDMAPPSQWRLPLVFEVSFVKQLCDLTNAFKGMNDALAQALGVDDSYFEYDRVRRKRVRGKPPEGAPRIEIVIREAAEEEAIRPQPRNRAPRKTRTWIGSAERYAGVGGATTRGGPAKRQRASTTPLQRAIRQALAADNTKPAPLPAERVT